MIAITNNLNVILNLCVLCSEFLILKYNISKMCRITIHREDAENVELFPNWANEAKILKQPKHWTPLKAILFDLIETRTLFSVKIFKKHKNYIKRLKRHCINIKYWRNYTSINVLSSTPLTSFSLADNIRQAPAHNFRFCLLMSDFNISFSKYT